MIIELRDVVRSYRVGPTELRVLKGVSLEVRKGELLAVVGLSGSGKSTLMNIMGLLDKPTSGTVFLDGLPVDYTNDRRVSQFRNQKIGFVFQSYHLLPRLTAVENVGLPLVYRGLRQREVHERAMVSLAKVEMAERAEYRPGELSGGQQQRVALARSLVGSPSLLLADEPTGALDTKTGKEIMGLLKRVNAEERVTVVLITHDLGLAAQCGRKIEISDGLLVGKTS